MTQTAIIDWFQFRQVCDNARFSIYFRRQASLYAGQYNKLLSMDQTEWDPMVADFMERQRKHRDGSTTTTNGVTGGEETSTSTSTGSGTATGGTTGSHTSSGSDGRTVNREDASTQDGTSAGTSDETGTESSKATGSTSSTASTSREETGTEHGTETSSDRRLAGQMPDSSAYGQGLPTSLNWAYTSTQEEAGANKASDISRGNIVTGSDNSSGETESQSSGEHGRKGSTTGTTHNESTGTGKETAEGTHSDEGTEETTHNDKTTSETQGETKRNSSATNSSETAHQGDGEEKERYSGRHEAPQDLLDRAYTYVLRSNALKHLIKWLEPCFFGVLDY